MNAKTIAELDLRRAQLAARAATLDAEWRTLPTGNRSTILGKRVKALREQADDYARLLRLAMAPAALEPAPAGTKELRKAS